MTAPASAVTAPTHNTEVLNKQLLEITEIGIGAERILELIAAGANTEAVDSDGRTPLMMATRNGYFAAVKTLVENRANVNARLPEEINYDAGDDTEEENYYEGATPLIFAISTRFYNFKIVECLIGNGAALFGITGSCDLPLNIAARKTRYDAVSAILTKAQENGTLDEIINYQGEGNDTPLHNCRDYSNPENAAIISLLLNFGANPNILNHESTPLIEAIESDSIASVEAFLGHRATKIDAKDIGDKTALFCALESGLPNSLGILHLLIEKGADINLRNSKGEIPLVKALERYQAAEAEEKDLAKAKIKLLVEFGAEFPSHHFELIEEITSEKLETHNSKEGEHGSTTSDHVDTSSSTTMRPTTTASSPFFPRHYPQAQTSRHPRTDGTNTRKRLRTASPDKEEATSSALPATAAPLAASAVPHPNPSPTTREDDTATQVSSNSVQRSSSARK